MSANDRSSADWKPCPPGSLVGFAGQERSRQRRQFLKKAGGFAAVLLLAVSGSYLAWGPGRRGEPNFGGIVCTDVRANAMQYMAGGLDADLTQRIRVHLEQCPECQRFWKEMTGNAMKQVALAIPPHSSGDCGCEAFRCQPLLAIRKFEQPAKTPRALDQRLALSR